MIVTSTYEPKSVLIAMFLTALMVVTLTIYAMTTKDEFNPSIGMMFVLASSLVLFLISLIVHLTDAGYLFLCFLVIMILGIYIVYDTLLIVNGAYGLTSDDYIIASIIIYVDIINVFLYILKVVGNKR